MSRCGYTEDCDDWWQHIMWRGRVTSAIRGKRGQAFLKELVEALDAMPEKRLIKDELRTTEGVCALGCVGAKRGMDLEKLEPENTEALVAAFGIADAMVREIEWQNDENWYGKETPEIRWQRVRDWAASQIKAQEDRP